MVRIGNQAGDEIDEKVEGATMPGMLNLTDVFELVIDRFDDGSFAQQNLLLNLSEQWGPLQTRPVKGNDDSHYLSDTESRLITLGFAFIGQFGNLAFTEAPKVLVEVIDTAEDLGRGEAS